MFKFCMSKFSATYLTTVLISGFLFATPLGILNAGQKNMPVYDDPMIRNATGYHETVVYAHEQIKLYFRNTCHGKISFKKYQVGSMQIRYQVHDLEGKFVMQGTESAVWFNNKKPRFLPAVMIDLILPKEQSTGWFRVTANLIGLDRQNKEHVFGSTWVDLAIVPQKTNTKPDRFFGLSGPLGGKQPTPALTQYNQPILDRMGVSSLRVFTIWETMQPTQESTLNFRRLDRLVEVCKQSNVDVLLTLVDVPEFAAMPIDQTLRVPVRKPIPKQAYWEEHLKQMASHYSGKIYGWEVLNETNGFRQWPNGDPQSYADFFMRSYQIIRKYDQEVRVCLAGTTGMKHEWINAVARHGAGPMIDVVAVHPYRYAHALPERGHPKSAIGYGKTSLVDDIQNVVKVTSKMPSTLSGYRREIWSTESGYNTKPSFPPPLHQAISDKQQAQLLVRTMTLARTQSVDRFFWWRLYDTLGAGLGIIRNLDYDYMPKPAVVSYAVMHRQLNNATTVTLVEDHGIADVFVAKASFENKSNVHVIWSVEKPCTIKFRSPTPVNVTDMMGVTREVLPVDDIIELPVGPSPIYLQSSMPVVLFKP